MNHQQFIQRLQSAIEHFEKAHKRLRDARRELRESRIALEAAAARLVTIREFECEFRSAETAPSSNDQPEGNNVAKVSPFIFGTLMAEDDGMSVAGLFEHFEGRIKRSTISASLYNLKQRKKIEHDEVTGIYRVRKDAKDEHLRSMSWDSLIGPKPR